MSQITQQALLSYGSSGGNDSFTKALLHLDGTNGSTTITDSSAFAHAFSVFNGATISTAQSKFGGASVKLGTTAGDDIFSTPGSQVTDFIFGTGDFTIDFWAKLNNFTAATIMADWRTGPVSTSCPILYWDGSAHLTFHDGTNANIVGTTAAGFGWRHIAVTRSSGSSKLWVDGVQEGSTFADTINYTVGNNRPLFGASGTDAVSSPFDGWIDEIRISKGIARWNSAFTPPTGPYF